MSSDLLNLSAVDLLDLYRSRRASPVEVVRAVLQRIETVDPVLNAFCFLAPDEALSMAAASEARWMKGEPMGPLDGVPVSIKDILLTKGWPTLRGSKTVDPAGPWNDDAPAVARLRESGAVLLGKTTTPEFGWKGVTDSPLTGITRNPWNPAKTPGGSSGGGAAAVAAGMGPLTLGTDGGGSIRIPCAFTGLFGLKPSFGRVPAWPLSPFGTVAHVGPMTRTVADAALMLNVSRAPTRATGSRCPPTRATSAIGLDGGVRGWRIAYSPALGYANVDPEVAAHRRARGEALRGSRRRRRRSRPGASRTRRKCSAATGSPAPPSCSATSRPAQKALIDRGLRRRGRAGREITLMELLDAVQKRGALGMR